MNKKGMTLVEIIISIALISIVILFLFSLLINVKDINEESEVNSSYLIMKALIIKNIEEDMSEISDKLTIKKCENKDDSSKPGITQIYSNWAPDSNVTNSDKWLCINFYYADKIEEEPKDHLLGIYYYSNAKNNHGTSGSYVISYISSNKTTRLLNDFVVSKQQSGNLSISFKPLINPASIGDSNKYFLNINIPLIGTDNKDYSINIPYYGTIDSNSSFTPSDYVSNP